MNTARAPRGSRTISALILAGTATISLAGCSAAVSTDGTYVEIDSEGGVDSVWVLDGDSARFANAYCDSLDTDLAEQDPSALSPDGTEIKDSFGGDVYRLVWFKDHAWYPDGSGFSWDDRGDYVRDDSDAGQAAVEKWEAECGHEWPE